MIILKKYSARLLNAVLLCFFAVNIHAEQKMLFSDELGDLEIHYNAFNSTFLTPEVAKQYELVRSKAIGIVNIAVIRLDSKGKAHPSEALVEGVKVNNIQQEQTLEFKPVKEGKARYYLAQFQFAEGEELEFRISLIPDGSRQTHKFRFQQKLFNK